MNLNILCSEVTASALCLYVSWGGKCVCGRMIGGRDGGSVMNALGAQSQRPPPSSLGGALRTRERN